MPGQARGSRNRVRTRGEERIATSGRVGFCSPAPTVDVHVDLPVHQAVFLVWLEHVLARRNQAAAAA